MKIKFKKVLYISICTMGVLLISCNLNKNDSESAEERKNKKTYELIPDAPATEFTIKLEGLTGTEVGGYFTPIGKQVLETVELQGTVPQTFKTLYCNKIFLRGIKPPLGGYLKVTVLEDGKIVMKDSTNVDKKYVQMLVFAGGEGVRREVNHDEVIGYVRITCEKPMLANVQLFKHFKQNYSIYSLQGKTPFTMAITDCDRYSIEAYNDRHVMYDFTCDVMDENEKVFFTKVCKSTEPGIKIESYEFYRNSYK